MILNAVMKQRRASAQWRFEDKAQTSNKTMMVPTTDIRSQVPTFLDLLRKEPSFVI